MTNSSTAPPPPPGGLAERPTEIPARGWFAVLRRTFAEMGRDHATLLAGGVACAWVMALFPGLIAAVLTYGLVTDPADVQRQIDNLLTGLPADAQSLLADQMTSLASTPSSGLGIGLLISIALALWSASAGIAGLVEAVNLAYDEEEMRGFIKKRALALLLTLGFLVFLAVAIALVAVLPAVLDQLGLGVVAEVAVQVARWGGLVVLMIVALGVLYRLGPDRDDAQVRWVSTGAVTATLVWVAASVAFSLYVDNFGSYGETYGSLAGVAVLLLWLWITALVVLVGAELNAETEAQTLRDTTVGEPRPLGERGAVKADELPPADAG
ncbi:MAG: YihY/virulence factor BrkB family protein [Nocardioidaceae bacterium]|nr:YihY/virulence factor BrkB family protein [Nocardioidaceae bacterium]